MPPALTFVRRLVLLTPHQILAPSPSVKTVFVSLDGLCLLGTTAMQETAVIASTKSKQIGTVVWSCGRVVATLRYMLHATILRIRVIAPSTLASHLLLIRSRPSRPLLPPTRIPGIELSKEILFEGGRSNLQESSNEILELMVRVLLDNPLRIRIEGHVAGPDEDDDEATNFEGDNHQLSLNRAQHVVDFMVSRGVHAGLLTPKGFGASKPNNTNDLWDPANRKVACTPHCITTLLAARIHLNVSITR